MLCHCSHQIYFTVHMRAQPRGPSWGPALKKYIYIKNKKILQKLLQRICDFSVILVLYFGQYRFVFLYCKDTNPVLKYPVFVKKKMFIKKKCFVFMHMANTLTCFECSFYKKKYIGSFESVFLHRFLKHKLFSCISGFYNMFVKLQRVLANIPKTIKILFLEREFIYYSPLMFG